MGGKQAKEQLAEPTKARAPITKLPDYFPTYHPACTDVAKTFFTCFETHARILVAEDVASGKKALETCQPQLVEYAICMEKNHSREGKKWWNLS